MQRRNRSAMAREPPEFCCFFFFFMYCYGSSSYFSGVGMLLRWLLGRLC